MQPEAIAAITNIKYGHTRAMPKKYIRIHLLNRK